MFNINKWLIFTSLIWCSIVSANNCPKENSAEILWSGGEHLYLGDRGFLDACEQLQLDTGYCQSNKIPRKDEMISMSYGQLIVLGDFYLKENLAFEEVGNTEITDGGLERIFKCIDSQGKVHQEQRDHPEVEYPSCDWVTFINSRNMIKTILANTDHFGWHNMKAYVRIHGLAIKEAILAGELRKKGLIKQSDLHLRNALFINGFADHFLTDAFAAGHIRVPRFQLKKWASSHLGGFFKEYKGDILSMLLHDTEAKDSEGTEIGLQVQNSLGDSWKTLSDDHLNECRQEDHIGIRLPVEAVKLSVIDIFKAYQDGESPNGVYEATNLVPFSGERGLAASINLRINEKGRVALAKKLRSHLPVALKLVVSEKNIRLMLSSLEDIMQSFREDIEKDINVDSTLKKRLPDKYLKAYLNIN
ncbi:MAG: hypothetical protein H6625_11570 [Bdellovibrionaceae bacterium]|nr:hypothetical protein [Pseudobdellovibrionaceae bacterium]